MKIMQSGKIIEIDLEKFPFYWLTLTSSRYEMALEEPLKKLGLDNSKRRILVLLASHPFLSVSDIAEHAILKVPTTTRIISRMKEDGLVEISANPKDGRSIHVKMTALGHEKLLALEEATHEILNEVLSVLTEQEIDQLNDYLKSIFNRL